MPETLPAETIAAIFDAALTSPHWWKTNLGDRVDVRHAGYSYTVEIHYSGRYLASIVAREGYGGTEWIEGADATQAVHRGLVAASQAAVAAR